MIVKGRHSFSEYRKKIPIYKNGIFKYEFIRLILEY